MKLILQGVVMMFLALSTRAASFQDDIVLPFSILDKNKTIQTKEVGDDVKAIWSCRVGEFYGWEKHLRSGKHDQHRIKTEVGSGAAWNLSQLLSNSRPRSGESES